ncbi:MAG: radical SAM protein [candidate division KSB1 bacterium]|nr:radical SAM protein [candidate division KSB1 bacterium]
MLASLLPKIPLYWSFYRFGFPKLLPFSIVISVSYRCNSKCRTCDVWRKPNDDLTLDEWTRVFQHIGNPVYLTFTGGEPFLRKDLPEMVIAAYEHCHPEYITIPTNGILTQRIVEGVEKICAGAPKSRIGINLSLDGIGAEHDDIRLVPGNWDKAMETWRALKELQAKFSNLVLSIHTVISQFNIKRFPEIYNGLQSLAPDSYITEVAEERVELDTVGLNITPMAHDYAPIADMLSDHAHATPARGFARVTQSFRARYYQIAKRTLIEQRQIVPCFAGWASGHIAPNGDVWSCCIRAEPIGNLRETNYDLKPIWFEQVGSLKNLRRSIAAGECACPMANASYANMLLHPPTLMQVARELLTRPKAQLEKHTL